MMTTQKIRKIYRLLNVFSYSMTLPSEKGYRSVEFFGGSRKTGQKGMLITEDPELQKALEKHSSFNREYYLESQTIVREETPVVPETVSSEEVVEKKPSKDKESKNKGDGAVSETVPPVMEAEETGVRNVSAAKIFLMNKFPEEKEQLLKMRDPEAIRAFGESKGVTFPEWK